MPGLVSATMVGFVIKDLIFVKYKLNDKNLRELR